jgi:heme iron utilization protein
MSAIAREAGHLIREHRWGALATINDQGEPLASMVAYALAPGATGLVLFLSRLAPHTRGLLAQPRTSLAVSEPDTGEGDPQRLQRASVNGTARVIARDTEAFQQLGDAYVERFPDALPRFELGDFVLFELVPEDVRYVGGFARTARLTWAEVTRGE